LFGQDLKTVPYLPLVYEVRFPPSPVKGEGGFHLIYELHLANFSRRQVTLHKAEILGQAKDAVKVYEGDRLPTSRLAASGSKPETVCGKARRWQ
jgi:hypothetical protein